MQLGYETGAVTFETRSGDLTVKKRDGGPDVAGMRR
jgi:hypothetical protein